jgi:hypothetical protein
MNILLLLSRQPELQHELDSVLTAANGFPSTTLLRFEHPEDIQDALTSLGSVQGLLLDLKTESIPPSLAHVPHIGILPEAKRAPDCPCIARPVRPIELRSLLGLLQKDNATDDVSEFALPLARDRAMIRFHSGIAHDINNRLSTLTGYLSMLPDVLADEDEMIEDMEQAADGIAILIRRLQAFKDRDIFPPGPLDLVPLLRSIQDLATRLIHPDAELLMNLPDSPLYIWGDEASVEFLLVSTLGWFSGQPDTITIQVDCTGNQTTLSISGNNTPISFIGTPEWEKDTPLRNKILTALQATWGYTSHDIHFHFSPSSTSTLPTSL